MFTRPNSPTSTGFMHARFVASDAKVTQVSFELLDALSCILDRKVNENNELHEDGSSSGYLWLHLDRDDSNVIEWLKNDSFFDEMVIETLIADDSRPRTIAHHQGVLLNLRGVNLNPQRKPEEMLPIRLWLHEHIIITMQIEKLRSIDDLLAQVDNGNPPLTQAEFVADLANLLLFNMESTINRLERLIDNIEKYIFNDTTSKIHNEKYFDKSDDITQELSYVRRTAIMLYRFLAPQKVALHSFSNLDYSWVSKDDRFKLQDVTDQTARITEELDEVQKRATIVHEYMAEQRMERMNKTMLLLAIVSVIFIPMTLISGLFGMNVGGLPWTENAMGFVYTLIVIAITGVFTFVVLKIFKMF